MVAYERFKMRGTIIVYFEIFYIDSKSVVLTSLVFAGFQIAFVFPSLFQIFFFCDPENAASDLLSKNKFVWSSWWTFFLVGFYAWIYAKQHKGFLFITWCQRRKYTNLFLFVIFFAVWTLTIVMPVCTFLGKWGWQLWTKKPYWCHSTFFFRTIPVVCSHGDILIFTLLLDVVLKIFCHEVIN